MPMRRLLFTRQAVCLRNHDECRSIRFSDHESPHGHYPFQGAGGQAAAGRVGHLWYETVPDFTARSLPPIPPGNALGCARGEAATTSHSRVQRQAAPGDHAIGDRPTVRDTDAAFRRSRDTFLKQGHTTDIAASNMHWHPPVPGCWRSRLRSSRRQRDHPAPRPRSHSDACAIHRVGGLCGHANVDTAPAGLECPA